LKKTPRHKLAFRAGLLFGISGVLIAFASGMAVLGRSRPAALVLTPEVAASNPSAALGLALMIGAFVLLGIGWYLACKEIGIDAK